MAIINCPECGREISDQALSCPNCGAPVKSTDKKFCKFCGEQIDKECVVCPKCGKQVEYLNNPNRNIVINNAASSSAAATAFAPTPKPQEKESPWGIVGLIFSLIFCFPLFPILGMILCIKSFFHKKHTCVCGIIGFIFSIGTIIISCICFSGLINTGDNSTSSNNSHRTATSSASTPRATSGPTATPRPTATPEPDTYITLEEFNLIETGMTYSEVVEIVGCEGTLLSTAEVMDTTMSMYCWYGKGGIANANVTLENDVVVSKAQIGLE